MEFPLESEPLFLFQSEPLEQAIWQRKREVQQKIIDMYPLDFEEFLWAKGISDTIIDEIRYKGAIFENLFADIFSKMGRNLYYFRKDTGLEVDFLMRYKG